MMVRRGLLALLLGAVTTLFESSSAFLIPAGPNALAQREQHHHRVRGHAHVCWQVGAKNPTTCTFVSLKLKPSAFTHALCYTQPLTAAGAVVRPAAGIGRRRGRATTVGPLRMAAEAEAEAEAEAGKVQEEMEKIKPMKIKEIKAELDVRHDTSACAG